MRPLVIVRPEPGASATATAAREIGLSPIVMPLFAIEPVEWRAPDPSHFDALLLTSANAVTHGGSALERLRSLPAHCVGEATARAARDGGFEVACVGTGGVDSLLEPLPPGLRLLHLCGVERRDARDPRQAIEQVPVYSAVELPAPEQLASLEGAVVALHSPRAGARLSRLADEVALDRSEVRVVAMSEASAAAAGDGWERVEWAAEPSDPALLALASQLCNNPR